MNSDNDATTVEDAPGEKLGVVGTAKSVLAGLKSHQLTLLAGGVAFYALLSLVPSMIAAVSIYGLVSEPEDVRDQVEEFAEGAPESARELLVDQLDAIVSSSSGSLGLGVAIGTLLALWSASGATMHFIGALNVIYGLEEDRKFFTRRGLAIGLLLGAILLLSVMVGALAVVPAVMDAAGVSGGSSALVSLLRWPLLIGAVVVGLSIAYRVAPNHGSAGRAFHRRFFSMGALVGALLWIAASAGFSTYVSSFGSYNETYGSMAAIVVLMLWLMLSVLCFFIGAEVNAAHVGSPAPSHTGESLDVTDADTVEVVASPASDSPTPDTTDTFAPQDDRLLATTQAAAPRVEEFAQTSALPPPPPQPAPSPVPPVHHDTSVDS